MTAIESEPTFYIEAANAKPICATRAPTPVIYSAFRPLTTSVPRALISVVQDARTTIVAVNAAGEVVPLVEPRSIGRIQLSADGSALAYEVLQGPNPANNLIEIRALASKSTWRVTPGDGCAILGFALDAAGQRLAYLQVAMRGRFKPAAWQITIADRAVPENSHTLRGESETALVPLAWSAATDALVYQAVVPFQAAGRRGVWQAQPDGSNLRRLLRESDFVGEPRLAPDGRWLAYLASDPDRLPKAYVAGVGEPPANRITVINLLTGEKRTLAETAQGFSDLAWKNARAFFVEGVWDENRFRYDRISSVQVNASLLQTLVAVAPPASIGHAQACGDASVVYSVRSAEGAELRWWQDGIGKTLMSAPNAEYRILGCVP